MVLMEFLLLLAWVALVQPQAYLAQVSHTLVAVAVGHPLLREALRVLAVLAAEGRVALPLPLHLVRQIAVLVAVAVVMMVVMCRLLVALAVLA